MVPVFYLQLEVLLSISICASQSLLKVPPLQRGWSDPALAYVATATLLLLNDQPLMHDVKRNQML